MFIPEYVRWCNENGRKIANDNLIVKTNTNYDFMPIPTRLFEFPDKIFFGFFSDKTFSSPPVWINCSGELTNIVLTDATIQIEQVYKDKIIFSISLEEVTDNITYTPDGKYHCNQSNILLKDGREQISLVEYVNNYPLIFKTTDDAVIEGNEICMGAQDAVLFVANEIYGVNWDKYQTDIHREFGKTIKGKKPIQTALLDILNENNEHTYLIYDHGTGEIADYITITEKDTVIEAALYHVKAMKGKNYNSDLNDIYEVTQQAIKSTTWLKSRGTFLEKIRYRRRSNRCELKKGKYNDLEKTLKQNKLFTVKIVVVQPAINKSVNLPGKYQEVLAATRFYIKNSGRVTALEIWGSQ